MSYNFSFADNAVYSAADVNKITSRLVTSGIEDPFTDGVPYNLSAFNDAGALLYTDGVVPETVNTLKVVKAEENGKILIYPGTAFFKDGSVIEIENGGEMLAYTAGAVNYVYLKNDLINQNTSYPVCSVDSPTGDYVLLAEISKSGTITDKRTYAMGKLPGYQSNSGYLMKITDNIKIADLEPSGLSSTYKGTKTYNIGANNYQYILAYKAPSSLTDGYSCLGLYSLADGSYVSFAGNEHGSWLHIRDALYLHYENNARSKGNLSLADGVLTVDITYRKDVSYGADFSINLYLF